MEKRMIDPEIKVRVTVHEGPTPFPHFAVAQDQNHPTGKAEDMRKRLELSLEPIDALIARRSDQSRVASQGASVFDRIHAFPDLRDGVTLEGWVQAPGQLRR